MIKKCTQLLIGLVVLPMTFIAHLTGASFHSSERINKPLNEEKSNLTFVASNDAMMDLTLDISSVSIDPGENVCLPVTVTNFDEIVGMEVVFEFDPSVIEFVDVQTFNLKDLSASSFGRPGTGTNPEGRLKLSWLDFSATGVTLPDGTAIFEVCFQGVANGTDNITLATGAEAYKPDDSIILPILGSNTITVGDGMGDGGGSNDGSSDLTYSISSASIIQGQQTCLSFSVDNFESIIGTEVNITYDPTVLEFVDVQALNLKDLSSSSFGRPGEGSNPLGTIKLSWLDFSASGVTLADGTVIFELCFEAVAENGTSIITLGPNPEAYDPNDNIIAPAINAGTVTVGDGSNNGGGGSNDLTYTISGATLEVGQETCLSFSVENFEDIIGTEVNITFDPNILRFVDVQGLNLKDLSSSSFGRPGEGSNPNGVLKLSWLDFSAVGVTLPDGTVIFEVCFEAIGSGTSIITLAPNPEAYDPDNNIIEPEINAGIVVVTGNNNGGGDDLTYSISSANLQVGQQTCLEFSVDNFQDIIGTEINIIYNPSILEFVDVQALNLQDLSVSSFGRPGQGTNPEGVLKLSWLDFSAMGISLPDGTVIFEICFEALASGTSAVSVDQNPEAYDPDNNIIEPFVNAGTVTVSGGNNNTEDLTFSIGDGTANRGEEVCLDFQVQNFEAIVGMELVINYDPARLQFIDVRNFNLKDLSGSSFGRPGEGSNQPGSIKLSWLDLSAAGVTLADGTTIFQLCFEPLVSGGTATVSIQSGEEAYDTDDNVVDTQTESGIITIGGGVGSFDDFALIIGSDNVMTGDEVCLPVSVANFANIVGMEWTLNYDPSLLQFSEVRGFNLKDLTGSSFGLPGVGANPIGAMKLSWIDLSAAGVTLSDNTIIFEVCFTAVAPGTANVTINESETLEVTDGDNNILPYELQPGTVGITGDVVPTGFAIDIGRVTTQPNVAVDVPIRVFNFDQVVGMEFVISYDPAELQFDRVDNFNLKDLTASSFGRPGEGTNPLGSLKLSWLDLAATGISVPDDTQIFTIRFTPLINSGVSSIVLDTSQPIEFIDTNEESIDYTVIPGSVTVMEIFPLAFDGTPSITDVDCRGDATGAIDIEITGGSGDYTYSWSYQGRITQDLIDIPQGTYTVTVTDNGTAETITETFVVNEPASGLEIVASVTDATCRGTNDGSISLNITGGAVPLNIVWSGDLPDGTPDQNNLDPGVYSVTIVDNNGCSIDSSITIGQVAGINIDNINTTTINSGNDGAIDLVVSGGTGNYQYSWTGPTGFTSNESNLSGLSLIGEYCVTITDGNNCIASACVILTERLEIASQDITQTCPGESNGSITVNVSGGLLPYTYAWNTGANTASISNLGEGDYTVTVTDGAGNSLSGTFELTALDAILISANVTPVTGDENNTNGSIDLTISGGTPSYTIRWNTGASSEDLTNLVMGQYDVTITDQNSCSVEQSYEVVFTEEMLNFNAEPTNILCNGDNTGEIRILIRGGVSPYAVTFSDDVVMSSNNGLVTRTDLPGGIYNFVVTDAANSTEPGTVTILEPDPIEAISIDIGHDVEDAGCTGSIDLVLQGGTPNYTVRWNSPNNGAQIIGLCEGSYIPTIIDENNCEVTLNPIIVTEFGLSTNVVNVTCPDDTDGGLNLMVNGGSEPFNYEWRDSEGNILSTNQDLFNRAAGEYTVTVNEGSGNTLTRTFTIGTSSMLSAQLTVLSNYNGFDVSCPGSADGRVRIDAENGDGTDYIYEWILNEEIVGSEAILNSAQAGNYTVTVIDEAGCTTSEEVELSAPSGIDIDGIVTDISCPGQNDGEILVSVVGGVGPTLIYNWSNGETSPRLRFLRPSNYTVSVTDGNNCTGTASFTIEEPEVISVEVVTEPATDGCNGTATAIVSGGKGPFFFEWNADAANQDSTLTNLCPGDYVVRVTDARGCTTEQETIRATVQDRRFPCTEARDIMTPDGDGLNERFLINCVDEFNQNTLRVFNRYGQLVFQAENYDNSWNGTTGTGESLPEGPYYYILDYVDFDGNPQQLKGSITLLREE